MNYIAQLFLWFVIYSFIGWFYESTLCSICQKTVVNRGFLNGPLCPVYGFGALAVILLLGDLTNHIVPLFLSACALTTALEYFTSYIMEKLFHARWWDYSTRKYNVNGRVCLLGNIVFGLMSVMLIKWIHPWVSSLTHALSLSTLLWLSAVLLASLLFDLFITIKHILMMNGRLQEIQKALNDYRLHSIVLSEQWKEALTEIFENTKNKPKKYITKIYKFQNRRIIKAFPI